MLQTFLTPSSNQEKKANTSRYIACPTGSQADQDVFATCEKLGITFVEQSVRLVSQHDWEFCC